MCLKAVSTDLKANFCEPWLVVFHRNWSRRAEIVAEQQKSPHRKKVGVDGWVNTAFDDQDHCTISTVRLFTRPWSYLQYSDKRYDWTGSYITPFYSNTFYSAPHSPSVQHRPSWRWRGFQHRTHGCFDTQTRAAKVRPPERLQSPWAHTYVRAVTQFVCCVANVLVPLCFQFVI